MPDSERSWLDLLEPVLTARAMREADRCAIEDFGLPGFTLMENAGRAAVRVMENRYGRLGGKTVVVVCGKGNNGGDGFVVARVLHALGARVDVVTTAGPDALAPDARRHFDLLCRVGQASDRISISRYAETVDWGNRVDCFVDALLGTGVDSAVRPPLAEVINRLNRQNRPVVAIDLPSGLHADTGEVLGVCVKADLTVTMGALKAGLLLNQGPGMAGEVEVVEMGIPRSMIDSVREEPVLGGAFLSTAAAVDRLLPRRSHDAHKYSVGLALVVAGSPGLTGAPVLAATAAARSGAGAVVCACPESVHSLLAVKFSEVMPLALPDAPDGIEPEKAMEALVPRLRQARAVLVGCGLGRASGTQQFVRRLLERVELPAVIDADGLNALEGYMDRLQPAGRWILTPHAGEFKRLAGEEVDLTDRLRVVREYARKWNSVLILKGMPSVVASPDGTTVVNATGGPALATAGSGDVLAGLCAGFLAQGLEPLQAAVTALHLGGEASDRYGRLYGERSLMASDLLVQLPYVMGDRPA